MFVLIMWRVMANILRNLIILEERGYISLVILSMVCSIVGAVCAKRSFTFSKKVIFECPKQGQKEKNSLVVLHTKYYTDWYH